MDMHQHFHNTLFKYFTNTKRTTDQKASVLDLYATYRPVFALSMSELGRFPNAEATFPLPPDTRPIDRALYRANPRAKAVIDKCVYGMVEWDIIEERPSPWGSPVYSCRREERKRSFLC